jgi:putative membrane-bound dehydrogenase-like protein
LFWLVWLLALADMAGADDFPQPENHGADATGQPLDAQAAAASFRLPEGFRAEVFAAEPDLQNPVAMTWDGRGRMWVAEYYTYADRPLRFDLGLRDRVLILADRDGDGRADERRVFCDNVQRLTSIEVGLGGLWLIALPRLLFIPDRDGNDVPDGPPEVVLDGFETSTENYHNCASGLRWGPDGWLYGRCGASSPGWIGPPGSAQDQRVPIYGGIWRYHPARKVFETICHGTTNPWGHDWDEHGELFFTNTVTGHLFHVLPGAHYTRSATVTPNRRVYETIDTHADHYHWERGRGTNYREVAHDALGGGHAHCGALVYLADQWPAEYRGKLLTLNFHGRRINVERLERERSSLVARHEPDMAFASDPWFRGIDLSYGPDGSVYVLDWSDIGECHEHDGVHRRSGRIFRIAYGEPKPQSLPDLPQRSAMELAKLHTHANEWYVRQARRELANRAARGADISAAIGDLRSVFDGGDEVGKSTAAQRLRALWTLYTLYALDQPAIERLLDDHDGHVRTWGVRLLVDHWPLDSVHGQVRANLKIDPRHFDRLVELAKNEPQGLMRLVLAGALQRLPLAQRPALASALLSHAEDASDHNLPKLVFYGLAPLVESDPASLVLLAAAGQFPLTREWLARALAEDPAKNSAPLAALMAAVTPASESVKADVLRGLAAGLAGRRKADPPEGWGALAASLEHSAGETQELVRNLNVVFGDGRALDDVRRIALDGDEPVAIRRSALETLIEARPDDLRAVCERLLRVRFLNTTALAGLTLLNDPEIGASLARNYRSFHPTERGAVIDTLVSRPAFAAALLDAIAQDRIPREDLTAVHARQIRNLADERLTAQLAEVWGELRDSPRDKQELIDRLKNELIPLNLAAADLRQGRAAYQTTCANCHKLFGTGGTIGPDLTGAGRHNLDYLLGNIVDPSAIVNKDYRMSVVRHADGRVLSGIIVSQDDARVVLQMAKEKLTILREEINQIAPSTLSVMPDGILQPLSAEQIRNLVAYLMAPGQVELPPGVAASSEAAPREAAAAEGEAAAPVVSASAGRAAGTYESPRRGLLRMRPIMRFRQGRR